MVFAFLALFAVPLVGAVARKRRLFFGKSGRAHRVLGLLELGWLFLGVLDATVWPWCNPFLYDAVLSSLGIALTYTAAAAFGAMPAHARPSNSASGALDAAAVVSAAEMWEHLFYQIINALQALYLHAASSLGSVPSRAALCVIVTLPWSLRRRFPVNSFSANWRQGQKGILATLYQLKVRTLPVLTQPFLP